MKLSTFFVCGLFALGTVSAAIATDSGTSTVFVNTEKEEIKDSPAGRTIATLLKSSEVQQVELKGEWAKVSLTGWVKTSSLVSTRPPAEEHDSKNKWTDAGGGISYRKVRCKEDSCIGELRNTTEVSYQGVSLTLSLYNGANDLIASELIGVQGFRSGEIKSFDVYLGDVDASQIKSFSISFNGGF